MGHVGPLGSLQAPGVTSGPVWRPFGPGGDMAHEGALSKDSREDLQEQSLPSFMKL